MRTPSEAAPVDAGDEAQGSARERLAALRQVCARLQLTDLSVRIEMTLGQAEAGLLPVAVLGQFKAGKSSLLNALVGADLLPVGALPATSTVTTLRAGDVVSVTVRDGPGPARSADPAELAELVTEGHNPGNRRRLRVEVTTPGLADLPDLVLVDTPGLGSTDVATSAGTLEWLPRTGAALLAVPATQPLAAADLDLVKALIAHTPHLVVVVTKADLLTPSDRAVVRDYVADRLREATGAPTTVLLHSTDPADADLRAVLRSHLRGWQADHQGALRATVEHRIEVLAGEVYEHLRLAASAADADADARDDLQRALDEERARLGGVAGQIRTLLEPHRLAIEAAAVDRLDRRTPAILETIRRDLRADLPSWRGSLADQTDHLRRWLTAALQAGLAPEAAALGEVLGPLLERGREPLDRVAEAFAQRLAGAVRAALAMDFTPPTIAPPTPPVPPVDVVLDEVFDSHLDMLSWAVPMATVRPLVHRHFVTVAERETETNALRLAYRVAQSTSEALTRLGTAYLDAMRGELDRCGRLADARPDDGPELNRMLTALATQATR